MKDVLDYHEICVDAINHFGVDHQLEKCKEELIELLSAIHDYQKPTLECSNCVGTVEKNIVDEIADVIVMMMQLTIIFDNDRVNERVEFKMNRLNKRIELNEKEK